MPPLLALVITLAGIAYLFRRDWRESGASRGESWLPFWWLAIACSREVSEWLQVWGVPVSGGTLEGGSPVDRLVYIGLIIAGLRTLHRREVRFSQIVSHNVFLAVFLGYCFLSVGWSDYPLVSLKRWIKVLGHPIMALVLLSEPQPVQAFTRLIKRCGYILVPVSILFIKYYPHLGRGFSEWTGQGYNIGIATDKNMLGINCLILGMGYFVALLRLLRTASSPPRSAELRLLLVFIYMNGWLLFMADSKTPLVSLCVGMGIALFAGFRWVHRSSITGYLVGLTLLGFAIESFFGTYEATLELLGRNANLTDRTRIWEHVLMVDINPLIGTGFESFWMGDRLAFMGSLLSNSLNQAHNGYLETYLNLGILGVVFLLLLLAATYRKAVQSLVSDPSWGRFCLGMTIAIMLYNWTEAAFKTTHPVFFMLYVIAIDYRPTLALNTGGGALPVEVEMSKVRLG